MKNLIVVLSFFWISFSGYAQDEVEDRPKIGVVLSGGGAKGLAHIGVLKVIEEAGVKIDYIAGTSMGAIIGGLYAAGYTASELDSIFQRVDSDALIQDYVPRISKSFYEKKNDEIYTVSLPFENFKIGVPKALSKGMYNYNLLSRLLAHVRHVRDFDELQIPFLCVATNAETGEAVILRQGNLPQAILASGAFPSLYSPVEIDGQMLIDGGVVNNYPIEELREMGADIVIGVDVQDGLKDREAITGATDLLLQISNFSTIKQMRRKRKKTDIYIKPDIAGYNVVSFDLGKEIIKKGEEAAVLSRAELNRIGGNPQAVKDHFVPKFTDTLRISSIANNTLETYTASYIQGKLGFRAHSKVTYESLGKGIYNLNGTQNFSGISYQFEKDGDQDILQIRLDENPIRRFLKLGLHYDGLYKSAALINITQKKLLFKNDVASLDVILGDNFRYNLNYYIDNGFYWSVGVSSKLKRFTRTVPYPDLENGQQQIPGNLSLDYEEVSNRLYFQTIFAQKFLIGVGGEHKYLNVQSKTISTEKAIFDRSNYLVGHAYVTFDSYDNKYFPTKGFIMKAQYAHYLYSSDYNNDFEPFSQLTAELGFVKRIYKKLSLDVHSEIGMTFGNQPKTSFFNFYLGGYGFAETNSVVPFFGYDFLDLFNNSYVKGSIQLDYEIFKRNHVNITANFANIGNSIFETTNWISKPKYTGYAVGYGMETLLGPMEIKHSWSPETRTHYTWFGVGFWF
ncbi:patatin-like phospholipase family protein [Flavobacterium sp. JP2137]|uniref:patatin-like phospholipase family protein n=1 Tax=Flavobacterium sp. JP2137 TaxID=3414510 RepID=UPI003D2FBC84